MLSTWKPYCAWYKILPIPTQSEMIGYLSKNKRKKLSLDLCLDLTGGIYEIMATVEPVPDEMWTWPRYYNCAQSYGIYESTKNNSFTCKGYVRLGFYNLANLESLPWLVRKKYGRYLWLLLWVFWINNDYNFECNILTIIILYNC